MLILLSIWHLHKFKEVLKFPIFLSNKKIHCGLIFLLKCQLFDHLWPHNLIFLEIILLLCNGNALQYVWCKHVIDQVFCNLHATLVVNIY